MATKVYDSGTVQTVDGEYLYITPLKIKYLRIFMDTFDLLKNAKSQDEYMLFLIECVRIAMMQYRPEIKTVADVEDSFDMDTIYTILELAAGISLKNKNNEKTDAISDDASDSSWDKLKLAELESELFLLGIWKDYEELESSLSMPEITATLNAKRESDYNEKKFLAAIQGIDLDEKSGNKKEDAWEAMKARVFSKGQAADANDITALQGYNAQKAGFGIGLGLSYERID